MPFATSVLPSLCCTSTPGTSLSATVTASDSLTVLWPAAKYAASALLTTVWVIWESFWSSRSVSFTAVITIVCGVFQLAAVNVTLLCESCSCAWS